ncbi:hypothetical protein RDABS01_034681 [Bienertia sinuspersici]
MAYGELFGVWVVPQSWVIFCGGLQCESRVMERLHNRHTVANTRCQVCGAEVESFSHAMFECKFAMEIWKHSSFVGLLLDAPVTSMAEKLKWVAGRVDKDELRRFCALMWAAWSCRNLYLFEHVQPCEVQMAAGYIKVVENYIAYAAKVNMDAHIREGEYVEVGAVVRDSGGKVLAAAAQKRGVHGVLNWQKPQRVYGVKMTMELGYMKLHLECDALSVTTAVGKGSKGSYPVYLFYDELLSLTRAMPQPSCHGSNGASSPKPWLSQGFVLQLVKA